MTDLVTDLPQVEDEVRYITCKDLEQGIQLVKFKSGKTKETWLGSLADPSLEQAARYHSNAIQAAGGTVKTTAEWKATWVEAYNKHLESKNNDSDS